MLSHVKILHVVGFKWRREISFRHLYRCLILVYPKTIFLYSEVYMRVISGFLKGRKLQGYNLKGTRPTMDKIKEAVFAIIQDSVRDTICLDLFAGSGSLGIEAISNGALKVYFVDNSREVIKVLKNNLLTLKIDDKSIIINNDYMKSLNYFKDNKIRFDLIFIDPPYKNKIIKNILNYISDNSLLNKNGQVICEYQDEELLNNYGNLVMIRRKRYNDKQINIFKMDSI